MSSTLREIIQILRRKKQQFNQYTYPIHRSFRFSVEFKSTIINFSFCDLINEIIGLVDWIESEQVSVHSPITRETGCIRIFFFSL